MDYHGRGRGTNAMRFEPRPSRDAYDDMREGRHKDRNMERQRSRSRSPGRRSEREWDRGKRRNSSPQSGRFDDARDHDRFNDRRPFNEEPPSRTIMLRGLPSMVFEAEIRHALDPQMSAFVDIRVPRSLEGGNRGFGFVEFANVATAVGWMEQVQGAILINDQRIIAHFCEDREMFQKRDDRGLAVRPPKPVAIPQADWECSRCGCNNFRHRNTCFRCEALRSEAEIVFIPSADDQVGLAPCNTLLLRNLDPATDEAKIIQSLLNVLPSTGIKTAKIMRDPRSQQSIGYGFVQFKVQHDCTEMYNCLMRVNPPLTVDTKQVAISFAKQPLNELLAPPVPTPFPNSGYNQNPGPVRTGYGQGNDVNSAAAVAQMALQNMQKSQMSATIVQQHMQQNQPHGVAPAGYQFDPTSGYYFDPTSQLYYDPKTQYFWNPQTRQFLAWNAQSRSYVVVPQTGQASSQPVAPAQVPVAPVEEKPKPETEKEKQAKKIVQDMEKWAKTMNQKQPVVQRKPAHVVEVKVGAVASVFKDAEEEEILPAEIQRNLSYKTISVAPAASSHFAALGSDEKRRSASLETDHPDHVGSPGSSAASAESTPITRQIEAEKAMVDWDKFNCLLCKRSFKEKDLLQKHLELSDLHLRNLDTCRRVLLTEEEIEELEAQERDLKYRDRAKERRKKYGETEPAPPLRGAVAAAAASNRKRQVPSDKNDHTHNDDSPAPTLGGSNVAAKLMKAMGYQEGKGLGKSKQGMVDPVEARGHSGTSGLGLEEGAPDILPTDTYASKVRKTMRNRFRNMHD